MKEIIINNLNIYISTMAKILQFFTIFIMTFFFLCNSSSNYDNLVAIGDGDELTSSKIIENYNDITIGSKKISNDLR